MARRLSALLFVLLTGLILSAPSGPGFAQQPPGFVGPGGRPLPPPAVQQQQPRGFFDFLFGPRVIGPPPPLQQPPPVSTRRVSRPTTEPAVAIAEVAEKDENARKILVVGDFVAGGLAWGLDQTFAEESKIAVIDRSNNASGLVRDDFYDWNAELPEILNAERPDVVVMVVGANDRQQMRIGKDRPAPHSETWEKTYVARVAGIAETLKVFGRPFFWVSAPPMRSSSASRDMAYVNGFYKPAVADAGGFYIDIWNGFTDENGRFTSSGPDVDGQLRALRNSDGINFTRAGRLKLAFYIEREIRKQTGIGAGAVDLLASVSQTSQIEIGPDGVKRLVGPVISLSDPLPGASRELAGGSDSPAPEMTADTPQYELIVRGTVPATVAGRADDYTWPPRQRASLVLPAEDPDIAVEAPSAPPLPESRP